MVLQFYSALDFNIALPRDDEDDEEIFAGAFDGNYHHQQARNRGFKEER